MDSTIAILSKDWPHNRNRLVNGPRHRASLNTRMHAIMNTQEIF
jgi:hypothetical protein